MDGKTEKDTIFHSVVTMKNHEGSCDLLLNQIEENKDVEPETRID